MKPKLFSLFIIIPTIAAGIYFFSNKNVNSFEFDEAKLIQLLSENSYVRKINVTDLSLQNCRLIWTYEPQKNSCNSGHRLKVGAIIVDLDILRLKPTKLPTSTNIQRAFWSSKNFKSTGFNFGAPTVSSINILEINNVIPSKNKGIYSYDTYCDGTSYITNEGHINLKLHKDDLDEVLMQMKNLKRTCE